MKTLPPTVRDVHRSQSGMTLLNVLVGTALFGIAVYFAISATRDFTTARFRSERSYDAKSVLARFAEEVYEQDIATIIAQSCNGNVTTTMTPPCVNVAAQTIISVPGAIPSIRARRVNLRGDSGTTTQHNICVFVQRCETPTNNVRASMVQVRLRAHWPASSLQGGLQQYDTVIRKTAAF